MATSDSIELDPAPVPDSPPPAPPPQVLAFYLPQFHAIPENDSWWGPGFTEWTNVARARPLFPGHEQPRIPGALGFYDLRVGETREDQAALARRHGVTAFCYWHYWFAGRRLLERPFSEVLGSGEPDFGFCLAWANQTWTGIWHGAEDRVLVEQTYPGPEDDRAHFESLLPAFLDRRYVRIDGRPLLYIFRPEQLPDPRQFTDRWRTLAEEAGLPGLYLVAEVSDLLGAGPVVHDAPALGFDAGVYIRMPVNRTRMTTTKMRLRRKLLRWPEVYDYATTPPLDELAPGLLPCVYPNWDNTPRAGRRGLVLRNSDPELFRVHLRWALRQIENRPREQQVVFLKSWNEWAEGNYLEPDLARGTEYLQVLKQEIDTFHASGRPGGAT